MQCVESDVTIPDFTSNTCQVNAVNTADREDELNADDGGLEEVEVNKNILQLSSITSIVTPVHPKPTADSTDIQSTSSSINTPVSRVTMW